MAANDHSIIRTKVGDHNITTDYTAIMKECQDEANWFQRARGTWVDPGADPRAVAPPRPADRTGTQPHPEGNIEGEPR